MMCTEQGNVQPTSINMLISYEHKMQFGNTSKPHMSVALSGCFSHPCLGSKACKPEKGSVFK